LNDKHNFPDWQTVKVPVTRGLDPRVHPLRKTRFAKKMDCRVKPGNDGRKTMAVDDREHTAACRYGLSACRRSAA